MNSLFINIPDVKPKFSPDAGLVFYPGDVMELLPGVPSGSVQLIITSPPYNLGKEYETRVGLKSYLDTQRTIIYELVRVLSDQGSICWQVGNYIDKGEVFPLDIYYYDIFKDMNLYLRNRIIWHFGHGLHARKRFSGRYETILWFTKTDKYIFNLDDVRVPSKYPGKRHYKGPNKGKPSGNPQGKNPSDFWENLRGEWEDGLFDIPNVKSNHPEKTIHPCQFPIELVERCILALTNPDHWVLDPFAGVGSTMIAAIKHNRRALGAEKEDLYYKIALERLDKFSKGALPARKIGTPVHEPSGNEKVARMPEEWVTKQLLDSDPEAKYGSS